MKLKHLLTFCKITMCKSKRGYWCQNNAECPRCLHRNTKEGMNAAKALDILSIVEFKPRCFSRQHQF